MYVELHYATIALVGCLVSYFSYVWGWNSCIDEYSKEFEEEDEESKD
jgi:hypothetical protein